MVLHTLHLCSGYGGFELGLKLAGIDTRTVGHVERDSHAAATLVARMEEQVLDIAPIWSEIATFDPEPWVGRVDIITAGFPCQSFSVTGRKRGVEDDRWIWPEIARVIERLGPKYILLENVPQLLKRGLPVILSDLAKFGYDAEWDMFSAREVGAPHIRKRIWVLGFLPDVGDANCIGRSEVATGSHGFQEQAYRTWENPADEFDGSSQDLHEWPPHRDDIDGWRRYTAAGGPEPGIRRGPNGRPEGLVDSLRLGGNGLVPQVAAGAFLALANRAGIDTKAMMHNKGESSWLA